jgi:hypothetical protein
LSSDVRTRHHASARFARANVAVTSENEVRMTNPLVGLWPPATVHSTRNEGIRLGLIVGTTTWLWVALVDAMAGRPWHTFSALGGVLAFTLMHYALNVTFGLVLLSAVHGAERTPSLVFAMIFSILLFQGAFVMLTGMLVQYSVGGVAWAGIAGGSIIGTAVTVVLLMRTHPILEYLRRAEEER